MLDKASFITAFLIVQIVLLIIGSIIVIFTSRNLNTAQPDSLAIRKESMLTFMGNIPAIIQLIVGFMMIDGISYNLSQKHIMPLWLFLVIVLVIAMFALVTFFIVVAMRINR